jgi:hypothetical protein
LPYETKLLLADINPIIKRKCCFITTFALDRSGFVALPEIHPRQGTRTAAGLADETGEKG